MQPNYLHICLEKKKKYDHRTWVVVASQSYIVTKCDRQQILGKTILCIAMA